jgi:hypothetical protein
MSAQSSMNWHCNMAEGLDEDDDPLYLIGDDEMAFAFAEVTGEDWDSCAARARLMTAAPRLLEAARFALAMPDGFPVSEWNEARNMLREAIMQAAGVST